ncbi:MAG: hypothetical protein IJA38_08135 [Bacteroidales bacterium]|nr:hypothetical protein [Bacteroidales bacterium]MBR4095469.1 hypothetical protein [Bacteroidales bacterium]
MFSKYFYIILFSVVLSFFPQTLSADTYRILFLNTESIKINGNNLTVGCTFNSNDNITWDNESQAVKVMNLSSNKIMVLTSKDFTNKNSHSIDSYLIYTEHLSTRDAKNGYNNSTMYMLDEISIPNFGNDRYAENIFVKFTTYRGPKKVRLSIDSNGNLIIPREIFGNITKPVKVQIVITENMQDLCLVENMTITLLPITL